MITITRTFGPYRILRRPSSYQADTDCLQRFERDLTVTFGMTDTATFDETSIAHANQLLAVMYDRAMLLGHHDELSTLDVRATKARVMDHPGPRGGALEAAEYLDGWLTGRPHVWVDQVTCTDSVLDEATWTKNSSTSPDSQLASPPPGGVFEQSILNDGWFSYDKPPVEYRMGEYQVDEVEAPAEARKVLTLGPEFQAMLPVSMGAATHTSRAEAVKQLAQQIGPAGVMEALRSKIDGPPLLEAGEVQTSD